MLAEAVVLSVIIGLVFKGSLYDLAEMNIKKIYLPVGAFALEIAGAKLLLYANTDLLAYIDLITLTIQCVVNVILIYFVYSNRKLFGMKVLCIGFLLNFAVILANAGYMPVDPALGIRYGFTKSLQALQNGQVFAHTIMTEKTLLNLLGDWIILAPPFPFPKTISIGDVIIDMGTFLLIFKGMNAGHAKKISV